MKKTFWGVLAFLFSVMIMLPACDSGGSGSSPVSSSLVGQWEYNDATNDVYVVLRILSSGNFQYTRLNTVGDDEGDINEAFKGTCSTSGNTLDSTVTDSWDNATENWAPLDPPEKDSSTFVLDGNTLTISGEETEVYTKQPVPAPDSNLTGTWVCEDVAVVLGADGKISRTEGTDVETGNYGVSTLSDKTKILTIELTQKKEGTASSVTYYDYKRFGYKLEMLPDPDLLTVITGEGNMVFERQTDGPALPAPDSSVIGMWKGTAGTLDIVLRITSDNGVERMLIENGDIIENSGGDGSGKGVFTTSDNVIDVYIQYTWSGSGITDWGKLKEPQALNLDYSVNADTLTLNDGDGDMVFSKLAEPSVLNEVCGIWTAGGFTLTLNADSTYELFDKTGSEDQGWKGTWGVLEIDGTDYVMLEATEIYNGRAVPPAYEEGFKFSLYEYELSTDGNSLTTGPTGETLTFTKTVTP